MESPSEAEKKRKLACDSCRKKKMKCEWDEENICNRCKERRINCIPHPVQAKRKERKPNTYLASLEDRLKRMEEAIKKPISASNASTASKRPSAELSHQSIPDRLSGLQIHDDGTSMFVGSSSGFSIISPAGMKWISDVTGKNDFEKVVSKIPSWHDLNAASDPKVWAYLKDSEREPLPSKSRALKHFDSFFNEGVNTMFPIFDETQVRERFYRQYPVTAEEDYAWYACLNMIFSISEMVYGRIQSPPPGEGSPSPGKLPPRLTEFQKSSCWKWFRNAASTFNYLQFLDGSLPAVQAMISMCLILQTLPNPHSSMVVAGAAMRLAQTIGLHRYLPHLKLPPAEVEQRRNIFWVGLIMERLITVRMGQPSVIHDDDIGVDLPKPIGPRARDTHLRHMSQIVLIQGKIYNSLYSAKSLSKSRLERLRSVGLLDEEVQYWCDQLPPSIRPGSEFTLTEETFFPTIMMQFVYFNSLTMIHRVSGLNGGPWTESYDDSLLKTLQDSDINPRVLSGGSICAQAARNAIRLLEQCTSLIGFVDSNMVRVISYYPLVASLTIFANVLHKPRDPQALKDLELMKSVVKFLIGYIDEEDVPGMFIISFFNEINRMAEDFVHKQQQKGLFREPQEEADKNLPDIKAPVLPKEDAQIDRSMNEFQQKSTIGQTPFTSPQYTFSQTGRVESPFTPSPYVTPPPFNAPAPVKVHDQQLYNAMATDPMALLDAPLGYDDPSNMNFNSDWMNGNDTMMQPELFVPHDGSWFFPWDTQNPSTTNFSNMDPDSAMQ